MLRQHVAIEMDDKSNPPESDFLVQQERQRSCWGTMMTIFATFPNDCGGFSEESPRMKRE